MNAAFVRKHTRYAPLPGRVIRKFLRNCQNSNQYPTEPTIVRARFEKSLFLDFELSEVHPTNLPFSPSGRRGGMEGLREKERLFVRPYISLSRVSIAVSSHSREA